jgi:cell division transport system permease protein
MTLMMTRFRHIIFFVHEAFVNMSRNKLQNSIAIGMIAVSLAIFGIFWLIYGNLNSVARRWSDAVHIAAYLDEHISEQQQIQIDAQIRAIENVSDVMYISPEDALKEFKKRLGDQEYLVDGIDPNPLPASYEIQLTRRHRDLASIRKVVEALQNIPHLDDIQYGQLENLTLVIIMLKFVGVFLGTFLCLTVTFIISNTIKLTLYTHEEELNIMKFIGATESFIKGPFLAEGVIRGFLGAVSSLVFLYMIHKLFLAIVTHSSQSLLVFSVISFLSWTAIISITFLGSFLGWCGSLLTLHKFLKTY